LECLKHLRLALNSELKDLREPFGGDKVGHDDS
jgi:hypothetical protein